MKRLPGLLLPAFLLAGALALSACLEGTDPSSTVVERGTADSLKAWPPAMRYARTGDSITLRVVGLRHGVTCAMNVVDPSWYFEQDTLGHEVFRVSPAFHTRPEPAGCPQDPGREAMYRRRFLTSAGKNLYLQSPDSTTNDTVTFVSGQSYLHSLQYVRTAPSDTLFTFGQGTAESPRLYFRDSTAGHPRRTLRADSLRVCEFLQAAVFERRGDTLAIRMRRLAADTLPTTVLPACAAGPRRDTVEVIPRLYPFP